MDIELASLKDNKEVFLAERLKEEEELLGQLVKEIRVLSNQKAVVEGKLDDRQKSITKQIAILEKRERELAIHLKQHKIQGQKEWESIQDRQKRLKIGGRQIQKGNLELETRYAGLHSREISFESQSKKLKQRIKEIDLRDEKFQNKVEELSNREKKLVQREKIADSKLKESQKLYDEAKKLIMWHKELKKI